MDAGDVLEDAVGDEVVEDTVTVEMNVEDGKVGSDVLVVCWESGLQVGTSPLQRA